MKHSLYTIYFSIALLSLNASALASDMRFFQSGVFKTATFDAPAVTDAIRSGLAGEEGAMRQFFQTYFEKMPNQMEWRLSDRVTDGTHAHRRYQLYYRGRRVEGAGLKAHYNLQGWLQYATNSAEELFTLELDPNTQANRAKRIQEVKEIWGKNIGGYRGRVAAEAIIWIAPDTQRPVPAFELRAMNEKPFIIRNWIVEETTGKLLEDRNPIRKASVSVKAYKVSPFLSTTADSVSVTVDSATKLRDSTVHVRREQNPSAVALKEVIPQDFTGAGFTTNPATYAPTCTGDENSCPNQAFDAVNVYYHLTNFRARINSYLTTLGATVDFTFDPLNVIINPLSIDFNGNGDATDETNNAMYVGQDCRSDDTMPRCLVFLRPAQEAGPTVCSESTVQFFDLAREALVVAHEYQHYVTDMITHIQFATNSGGAAVGDALHEGYSDYLAASYVSDLAARDVTLVGEYALQQCTAVERELSVLRVFQNTSADADPHASGLSWASALWQLRTELTAAVVDPLVVKSLFFLSTRPGFVESVESLVKADQALYAGAHVTRIRNLLYDTVHFIGGQSGVFRDSASGQADIGFRGCSVSRPRSTETRIGFGSLVCFILVVGGWIFFTLKLGACFKREPI